MLQITQKYIIKKKLQNYIKFPLHFVFQIKTLLKALKVGKFKFNNLGNINCIKLISFCIKKRIFMYAELKSKDNTSNPIQSGSVFNVSDIRISKEQSHNIKGL